MSQTRVNSPKYNMENIEKQQVENALKEGLGTAFDLLYPILQKYGVTLRNADITEIADMVLRYIEGKL